MLPWQMKSTLIIVLFLLDLSRNAMFCKGFWDYGDYALKLQNVANQSRIEQLLLPVSSKIGSKKGTIL